MNVIVHPAIIFIVLGIGTFALGVFLIVKTDGKLKWFGIAMTICGAVIVLTSFKSTLAWFDTI